MTVVNRRHPLHHLPGIVYFLEYLMLDVVCNTIFRCGKQRDISLLFVIVHGSEDRIFQSIGTNTLLSFFLTLLNI